MAVASNFHSVARELAAEFESSQGPQLRLSSASSGKLFTQVVHGAPFDVLLSADQKIPEKLESMKLAVPGSRFTYAMGRLALWSGDPRLKGKSCEAVLRSGQFRRLSLANARHAPYGVAAEQALAALGLAERVADKQVIGENIAQTFQFAATGNATLGLVALSQTLDPGAPRASCVWPISAQLHEPIVQQAVLLMRAQDKPGARAFLKFLQGDFAVQLITRRGYATPTSADPG